MTAPDHLQAAGRRVWDVTTCTPNFDQRDVHLLTTLCEVTDLMEAARQRVIRDMTDDKAHASYARLVDKQKQLLDAFGLTPRSRVKLGEVPRDEVADEMRNFAMN